MVRTEKRLSGFRVYQELGIQWSPHAGCRFGTFHLFHGARSAVSTYEKDYPNVTFVISNLGIFGADAPALSSSPFAAWPVPSLARVKGQRPMEDFVDPFIYVGPPSLRLKEKSGDVALDADYMKELQRREAL